MKIRKIMERGQYRPDDGDGDGSMEDKINQMLRKIAPPDKLWADVDEQQGLIEVYILKDGLVGVDLMQTIEHIVTEHAVAYFIGVSGGSQHAVYLNYKIENIDWPGNR